MHKDPDALAVVSHPMHLAQKAARAAFHQNLLLFLCAPLEVLPALLPALPGPVPLASAPYFPLPPLLVPSFPTVPVPTTHGSRNPLFPQPFFLIPTLP